MTLWETTVNPWSLHHHHPGPGVVDVEAVRGPQMDPQFHHTLLQDQPKLQKHMENQGSAGVGVADIHSRPVRNRAGAESRKTWAARHRHPPHIRWSRCCLRPQPHSGLASQQQKNYNQIQKTNTGEHTRRDSHRSKVTRSTSTSRLHKTSPGTDDTTAPPRHRQETEAGRAEE